MIEVERLSSALRLESDTGRLYWVTPSKFHPEKAGMEAGSPTPNHCGKLYWTVSLDGRKIKRGRIVFALTHGRWPTPCVDHINGDSLDDRPANLREATIQQNAMNHKRRARRILLPMGVRVAQSGRFQARISFQKKQHHLGCYDTPEQAHEVYLAKRKELFRDFA